MIDAVNKVKHTDNKVHHLHSSVFCCSLEQIIVSKFCKEAFIIDMDFMWIAITLVIKPTQTRVCMQCFLFTQEK